MTQQESLISKGTRIVREAGGYVATKCYQHNGAWLLWINGEPVAETDTRDSCLRLLAAILLKAGSGVV